jgi:hypothetical protein
MTTASTIHEMITGGPPEKAHADFYASGKNGYDDKSFDSTRFFAIACLSLQKTTRVSFRKPARVVILTPPTHDKWVIEQLGVISKQMFDKLKYQPGLPDAKAELARTVGGWFNALFVASRLLQLPEMPESWVALGFSKTDLVPDWLRDNLL